MSIQLIWIIFLFQLFWVKCFVHKNQETVHENSNHENSGEPLFLTPYIESGNIIEGRRLARVTLTESLNIRSYAGFFTVNKQHNSNQFFWYFPAFNGKMDAPVILFLAGGPGATSMFGLFINNGPLRVHNKTLKKSKYHWALDHHLIYVDNPVGTGFSFTKHPDGYCTNQTRVGEQLYSSMLQFFQLFPELQENKFFITGESYAGKYVPALAYTIYKKNPTADLKINLKALAIGNGFSDPEHQLDYSKFLYQIGLIDWNQASILANAERKVVDLIKQKQWEKALDALDLLIIGRTINGQTTFHNMTGFNYPFNYLYTKDLTNMDFILTLQDNSIRKSIHVGNLTFDYSAKAVYQHLKEDLLKSVTPWISELLEHIPILVFNGQLDILVAYPLTLNYLRNLNFSGAVEYRSAQRHHWYVDGELAGYVKQGGKLTEILVRNAGHMVPHDQPKWALDMITRFTHDTTYYESSEF